jgi:uncharacterized RDD family membrane protein YckC
MLASKAGVDCGEASLEGEVAGFWRRTVAFGIDCLVLGIIGLALAILFFDQLAAIGQWGRLIGFLIGSAYFGLMEGYAGRCQSVGKQALRIKVVRCSINGIGTLTVAQAWLRYAIVAVPSVLGGIWFIDLPGLHSPGVAWLSDVNSLVVFLLGTVLVYLLAFNRPSRQSLHDLAVSSLVVRTSASEPQIVPVRRLHWIVLGAVIALAIVASPLVNRFIASTLTDLHAIQSSTSSIPGVRESSVTESHVWHVGSSGKAQRTDTTIFVVSNPELQPRACTLEVARAAFSASPALVKRDIVSIVCARAVELGIASWRKQFAESLSGSEWALKIASHSGAPNPYAQ